MFIPNQLEQSIIPCFLLRHLSRPAELSLEFVLVVGCCPTAAGLQLSAEFPLFAAPARWLFVVAAAVGLGLGSAMTESAPAAVAESRFAELGARPSDFATAGRLGSAGVVKPAAG